MKIVSVKAANVKVGDVIDGQRVSHRIKFTRRCRALFTDKDANTGVLLIMPAKKGYDLVTLKFAGHERVKVKRPKYNLS